MTDLWFNPEYTMSELLATTGGHFLTQYTQHELFELLAREHANLDSLHEWDPELLEKLKLQRKYERLQRVKAAWGCVQKTRRKPSLEWELAGTGNDGPAFEKERRQPERRLRRR